MAWAFFIPVVLLFIAYAVLIENYCTWFLKVKPFEVPATLSPSIFFSVIIPARNEEAQIEECLNTVLEQDYPQTLFEVIVINDHSTDKTVEIIKRIQEQYANLKLLHLVDLLKGQALNSYKKKAIEIAVQQAKGDWIVTTDSDCFVKKSWLKTFNGFIKKTGALFVAAPVKFINTGSFISLFQCLDFISLQGITAASVSKGFHSMCNGANLAYNKNVFNEVGGFAGIDNIASGDDMLLMHKVYRQYPANVKFLLSPNVITETLPMPDWKSFFNQRIRWASKAEAYDDKRIFWVLLAVYLLNVSLVVLPFIAIWYPPFFLSWLLLLVAKTVIELKFMIPVARFFNETALLKWFPLMQPFHIVYTVIAGWLGKFGSYQWKGRTVK